MSPLDLSPDVPFGLPARALNAACLRPVAMPADVFRGLVRRLEPHCTCVLAHEQEYGTLALYVHPDKPLYDALPPAVLNSLDIQPQRAIAFQLKNPSISAKVQRAMNIVASRHPRINAAVVDPSARRLIVFEDPLGPMLAGPCLFGTAFLPECASSDPVGVVRIQKPWGTSSELEAIQAALLQHSLFLTHKFAVREELQELVVQPPSALGLDLAERLAGETLQALGLEACPSRSRIVLHQAPHVDLPDGISGEIFIPADCAPGGDYLRMPTHDVVRQVAVRAGGEARVTAPTTVGFPLRGVKCPKCTQALVTLVLGQLPREAQCAELSLTLKRNVLLATTWCDDAAQFIELITQALLACGIATKALEGPTDVAPNGHSDELALYLRPQPPPGSPVPAPAAPTAVQMSLRAGAPLDCPHCSALLRATVRQGLPVGNAAVVAAEGTLLVEFSADVVSAERVVEFVAALGYEPRGVQSGVHLLDTLQDSLNTQASPSLQSSDSDTVGPPSLAPEPTGALSTYAAKLYAGDRSMAAELAVSVSPDVGCALWLKDPASGDMVPVDGDSVPPLTLEHRYTVWYDRVVDRSKPDAPEATLVEVDTFGTLQEFWALWKQFDLPGLQEGDVIMVFRSHVQPNVHHPVNKAGGRWYTRALPLDMRAQLWTGLVVAMLGEYLVDNTTNEICGVVLSVKPGGDRIEAWVDGDYHYHAKHGPDALPQTRQPTPTMGDILAQVLHLHPGRHRLHYWTHAAYERHRKLHSGSARRDKRKHKTAVASDGVGSM